MPQATLLNFFKSQTPGPFATVALPPEALAPEVVVKKESDSRPRTSLSKERQSIDERATQPASQQAPRHDANISDPNDLSHELRLPGLTIIAVQTEHLPALKRLTGTLLPVRYPDKFFDGAVNEEIPAAFSRAALVDGKPVGWIRCRLDPFPEQTVPPSKTKPIYNRIYVQALCLLAPHRGLGIAVSLLDTVTAPPLLRDHDIAHIYAHVWENNEEALEWYDRRGFKKVMKVEQYYRKLRPNGAWVVKKELDNMGT